MGDTPSLAVSPFYDTGSTISYEIRQATTARRFRAVTMDGPSPVSADPVAVAVVEGRRATFHLGRPRPPR